MLPDLIIIDDVFDNPDDIVFKAKGMQYYDVYSHPDYYVEYENNISYYPGMRTNVFKQEHINFDKLCNDLLLNKILDKSVGVDRNMISVDYSSRLYFHYTTKTYVRNQASYHKDPAVFAGVVYLNKNPPQNSGTIVIKDDKEIVIENKYNRLVMYRGDFTHAIQNAFGNNVYDGRLTLTFFYYRIMYDVEFNRNKYFESILCG